jgi:hypothetical protein
MAQTKIPAGLLDKSAHVDFANNEKLRFGASAELEIYHDGTSSIIKESDGSGNLKIMGSNIEILNTAGQDMIAANSGSFVRLYHANSLKFATTSSGASVTGDLAVSGNLTISGTTTELDTTNLNVTDKNITLNYHASNDTSSNANGAGITIQDAVNGSTDATISWDASNDEFDFSHPVAIVNTVGGDTVLNLTGTYGAGNNVALLGFARSGGAVAGDIRYTDATTDMEIGTSTAHAFSLKTAGNKRIRIDSSGRVGINQAPLGNNFSLQVTGLGGGGGDARAVYLKGSGAHTNIGGTGPTLVLQNTNSTTNNIVKLSFESASSGETVSINAINTNHTSHYGDMAFNTRGSGGYSEKMRIEANGNVGIGTNAPSGILSIPAADTTTKPQIRFMTTGATNLADAALSTTDDSGGTNLLIGSNQYYSSASIARFDTSRSGSAIDFGYTGRIKFFTGSGNAAPTERMQINALGSVGVGVTPNSGWSSNQTNGRVPIQVGFGSISGRLNDLQSEFTNNAYASGTGNDPQWAGITRWGKSQIEHDSAGQIIFKTSPVVSDSAHNSNPNITWNERLIIANNGNVGIGTSSPDKLFEIEHVGQINKDTIEGLIRLTGHSNTENGANVASAGVGIEFYNSWSNGTPYSTGRISARAEQSYNGGLHFDVTDNTGPGQNNFTTAMSINGQGHVGIGNTECSNKLHVEENGTGQVTSIRVANENTAVGDGSQILFTSGTSTVGAAIGSYGTALNEASLIFKAGGDTEKMRIDSSGEVEVKAGRMSARIQNMFHIGADKHEIVKYAKRATYADGGSSNYAGYVYGQETYAPDVYIPYSPHQVYRLSASIHQLTNATGGTDSRHYIGLICYDENFNLLQVDQIGTYQYLLASNQQVFAGNSLEVDLTIKGWNASGANAGRKCDEGTVYIRPLALFNYSRAGGTCVLTGFNIQPAGTVAVNDSNAGTAY